MRKINMWCSCEPPHFLYRIFWPASVTLSYPLAKWHPISQDTFALLQLKRRSSSDTWAYEAEVQNFEKSLRGTLTADAEGYIHVEWSAAIFFLQGRCYTSDRIHVHRSFMCTENPFQNPRKEKNSLHFKN